MQSRLLAILTVAILTSGGLVFLNKEQTVNLMEKSFVNWKDQHAKEYATAEEITYRFAIYSENFAHIQEENSNQNEYTLGANKFMDLTNEEFRALYLGYKPSQQVAEAEEVEEQVWLDGDVDWRNKSAVTPIKDQGQCGSCWAFSATGSMESSWFLFGNVSLPSLSESQLVDCSLKNKGCGGGLMDQAFIYAIYHNMTTETDYPYVPKTSSCNKAAVAKGTYKLRSFTDIKSNDVAGLQAAVTRQPTSVAVDANNWQFYESGIFSNCKTSLDHGVLAVGFSSTFWIVKNSWGTGWGENGYIRIKTGNTCGIAKIASYPDVV